LKGSVGRNVRFIPLWLRVIVWLILCGRTGCRREGSRQSLRLVSCPLQALRPVLGPFRSAIPSFPLAMADEGQWKGMSLPKTREGRENNTCIPIRWGRGGILQRRGGGFQGRGESDCQKHARFQDGPNAGIGPLSQPQSTAATYTHPQILLTRRNIFHLNYVPRHPNQNSLHVKCHALTPSPSLQVPQWTTYWPITNVP